MPTHNLDTHTLTISELHPYYRNPRQGDTKAIARSLDTNGQYRPIVVNTGRQTGRPLEILAGNHTWKAAKTLGWDTIQAVTIDVDNLQAARIVAADNRTADLGDYDNTILANLLEDIGDLDGTGYTDIDLDNLLGNTAQDTTNTDDTTPPQTPISRTGDVWHLGGSTLVVGDGTNNDALNEALHGHTADLYVTDPPYNVAYQGKTQQRLTIQNDHVEDTAFIEFLTSLFTAAFNHTGNGCGAYVFHASSTQTQFLEAFKKAGFDYKQTLIWVKNTLVLGRQDYQWMHEPIIYGWKPKGGHHWYGGRNKTTVLECDKPPANRDHPTMKPISLIGELIHNSSKPGDIILDTCAGSGTTLLAAHQIDRTAAVIEIDPRYADVICKRFQTMTGELPQRDGEEINFIDNE